MIRWPPMPGILRTQASTPSVTLPEDIDLKEAHALGYKGKNIRIAVSDTGVDLDHEDLSGNALPGEHRNYALSNDRWKNANPYPNDDEGHGTAVAGLIAALGWNGVGSRGVAPEAKYAAFRFIFEYPDTITEESYLARLLDQMDGNFDIFNYSWGRNQYVINAEIPEVLEAYKIGATEFRNGKGALYVQSSGNSYKDTFLGQDYFGNTNTDPQMATPYTIVTAAVNATGVSASYSTPGSGVWVSAPAGEDGYTYPAMITTDIRGCSAGLSRKLSMNPHFNFGNHLSNRRCDYTNVMNGTSSAAPVTSGVIALMLEANPSLTWRDVKHILAVTSTMVDFDPLDNELFHPLLDDLSGYVYDEKWITNVWGQFTNAAGYHFSNWYGFGRINAEAAVLMARNYNVNLGTYETTANPNTDVWYYGSGPLSGQSIPEADPDGLWHSVNVDHNFIVEAVQIRVTTNHDLPSDLAVHLVSPNGTESRLLNINSGVINSSLEEGQLLLTNAFYGEESLGSWTIKVIDGKLNGNAGELLEWEINIHGHRKVGDGSSPSPVSNLQVLSPTYSNTTISPPVAFTHSPSWDVSRYEVSVGSLPGGTDKADWYSIGYNDSFQVLNMSRLKNNTYYYINVRAIDLEENISGTRTVYWRVGY